MCVLIMTVNSAHTHMRAHTHSDARSRSAAVAGGDLVILR